MKLLIAGYEGGEEVLKTEVKELLNIQAKTEPSVAIFEAKDLKEYATLAYLGQSFSVIIELIDSFEFKDFEDFVEQTKKIDFKFLANKKFKIESTRVGEHEFSSADVWPAIGEVIVEKETTASVDLKNPDIILQIYFYNKKAYLGINHVGFEIDKRDYKVYHHKLSIKGPLGYTLLRLADYKAKDVLLDPFPHSGTIPIEAAFLKSGFPINFYRKEKFKFVADGLVDITFLEQIDKKRDITEKDKKAVKTIFSFDSELRNMKAMKSNAKIGGVQDFVEFSKIDSEWIDLKFEKNSVDLIVSCPPVPGRRTERIMPRRYKEVFHNAEYVLKKAGKVVFVTNKQVREEAEKEGYKLEKTVELRKGATKIDVDIFVQKGEKK